MSRNDAYKMPARKFVDSKKARAQRMDEQNGIRRTARQAQSNAKRGLVEIDQNYLNLNASTSSKKEPVEITHEQKLKERLAKLKVWREQKLESDKKAKATKKQPFIVPGVARHEALPKKETLVVPLKPTGRVTRSQAKNKVVEVKNVAERKWIVSNIEVPQPVVNEVKSFAPENFTFSAPLEVAQKALEYKEPAVVAPNASHSDTPQKSKNSQPDEDFKISPLLMNNPWITTTRGSSSKKQQRSSLAAVTPSQDVQSSPYLKKRAGSLNNIPINQDALHFRSLMASEGSRLTDLCSSWDELLSNNEVPEDETGSVRTVIGQAQLLQRERFTQFAGLISQFENKSGEKEITPTDLEGFWEMIYLQVLDVDKKFDDLTKLRANGWIKAEENFEPKKKPKAVKKKPAAARPAQAARSNMRAYIAAARKNQLPVKSPGSPSLRRNSLLMSPLRTPGKRQSLRRSVLISSAKKPVFIVTDISLKNDQHETESEHVHSPVRRLSKRFSSPEEGASDENKSLDAMITTPGQKRTYGHTVGESSTLSPEERMAAAFDNLKSDTEHKIDDSLTPMRVLRTPARVEAAGSYRKKNPIPTVDEESGEGSADVFSPRRSTRLRNNNNSITAGRPSLLPVGGTISPVVPQENLMCFD